MTESIRRAPLAPEVIAANRLRWAEALESGNYPQTHGALRASDGYCCLGVAENIRGADWNRYEHASDGETFWLVDRRIALVDSLTGAPVLRPDTGVERVIGSFDSRQHAVLTGDGAHWLGLVETDPLAVIWDDDDGWTYESLTHLNDDRGFDFPMIAVVVRDQRPTWDGGVHSVRADVEDRVRRNATPIVYPRGAR